MKADDSSSDTEAAVSLRYAMSIRDAAGLRQELGAAIAAHRSVNVETDALTSVDIAILQVLIAAHKSARARGVGLRVRAARGGVLATALVRSGITESIDTPVAWDGDDWTGLGQSQSESAA